MRYATGAVFAAFALAAAVWSQAPYHPPRTPDGQPDIQGIWSNATITPLERPARFAGQAFLTPAEARALEQEVARTRVDAPPPPGDPGGYNEFWWDRGDKVVATLRTSLIIDPPDGRIPPLTEAARARAAAIAAYNREHAFDGPENRSLQDRCIVWQTAGPPMLPAGYNNYYKIVQAPGYVVILAEMAHDARVIPLHGAPALPENVRQYRGDSRGRWEGETLVVETANFTEQTRFRGSSEHLRVVERFRRTAPEILLYEFTVSDPATWERAWTAQLPMTLAPGPLFEYACQEGNISLANMLAGARAEERKAAAAAAGKGAR
jgi:hypothetical protein